MPSVPTVAAALALVLVPIVALVAVAGRRALVMALPFLVILNGVAIPVGGASLRLDQLAACALVLPLAAAALLGARRFRMDAPAWWLTAILGANVLSTTLYSPALAYSATQCAGLASAWVIHLLLLNFLDTRAELDAFLTRVLWAGVVACALGVGAYLLAVAGLSSHGAEVSRNAVEHLANAYGAYGTMVEPNLLGSFAAAHLVLASALLVARVDAPARAARWLVVLSAAALVLSFTRAAWLGALAGAGAFAIVAPRTLGIRLWPTRSRRALARIAVGAVALLLLAVVPGSAATLFRFKLANLVNLGSQTAVLRLVTYAMALQQTTVHPLIGWGTHTFAPLAAEGADFQRFANWRNLWIGNWALLALHDTGLVGIALWIALLRSIVVRGLRTARTLARVDAAVAARVLALTAAVASLLLPFLATTGFSLGFPWLLTGFLAAHRCLTERDAVPAAVPAHARLA